MAPLKLSLELGPHSDPVGPTDPGNPNDGGTVGPVTTSYPNGKLGFLDQSQYFAPQFEALVKDPPGHVAEPHFDDSGTSVGAQLV
jgi:hypothetical protein